MGTEITVSTDRSVAQTQDRPLNQTQMKNLERILDGDYKDLRTQVESSIQATTSRRIEAIKEQFKDQTKLDKAAKEVEKLLAKQVTEQDKLTEKLKADGITIAPKYRVLSTVANIPAMSIDGVDEAVSKVMEASRRVASTANIVINRSYHAEMRKVLLQGISSQGAVDLVNSLPKATDILSEMEVELSGENAEDLKTLGLMA